MLKADHLIRRKATQSEMDSVKRRRSKLLSRHKDVQMLERCRRIWDNMEPFRLNYARGDEFAYGDQWSDVIEVNGQQMTYRTYLLQQGNVALQTNQIKNKVESISGHLVKQRNEPVCHARDRAEQKYGEVMTEALQANCEKNVMSTLFSKWVKDLCLGGLAVSYESYDNTSGPSGTMDSWTSYINPNTVILEGEGVDPRFWDVSLVGRFYYSTFGGVCSQFAHSPSDFEILRAIYGNQDDPFGVPEARTFQEKVEDEALEFMKSSDPTRCYVCEVWTKEWRPMIRLWDTQAGKEEIIRSDDHAYREAVKYENESRASRGRAAGWSDDEVSYIVGDGYGRDEDEKNGLFWEEYWYCRFLAPDGTVLWEGESPYADGSHPFCLCAFPYMNGRMCGYLNDAIDINLAMNRALVLHDWIMRTQAKGVVVVPKQIVPDDISYRDFARSWTAIDDMVFIDVEPGKENLMPKVFFGAAQNFDVSNLISTYSRLMEQGAPVNGAMQGKDPSSGTSGTLYAQMVANSSTPIASLMEDYYRFESAVLNKKMKNIIMFYTPERFRKIAGSIEGILDDPDLDLNEVKDMEYDLKVQESSDTPVFRETQEQELLSFLQGGLIPFAIYLEMSSRPYADRLLQKLQSAQQQQEDAQAAAPGQGAVPPEQATPAAGAVSPKTQERMNDFYEQTY